MRGYVTFLIVFAAFALLISLVELNLNSKTHNLSDAIMSERFYRLQMNVKEVVVEAARQGAQEGFQSYAATHWQSACPDDPQYCFKQPDAEASAEFHALEKIREAVNTDFDDDIDVSIVVGGSAAGAHAEPDPASPSGWRLSWIELARTPSVISITMTLKENPELTATTDFPAGVREVFQ